MITARSKSSCLGLLDALYERRQDPEHDEPYGGLVACKLLVEFYAGLEDDLLGPMVGGYGKLPTSDEQELEAYSKEWGRRFANRGRSRKQRKVD